MLRNYATLKVVTSSRYLYRQTNVQPLTLRTKLSTPTHLPPLPPRISASITTADTCALYVARIYSDRACSMHRSLHTALITNTAVNILSDRGQRCFIGWAIIG